MNIRFPIDALQDTVDFVIRSVRSDQCKPKRCFRDIQLYAIYIISFDLLVFMLNRNIIPALQEILDDKVFVGVTYKQFLFRQQYCFVRAENGGCLGP